MVAAAERAADLSVDGEIGGIVLGHVMDLDGRRVGHDDGAVGQGVRADGGDGERGDGGENDGAAGGQRVGGGAGGRADDEAVGFVSADVMRVDVGFDVDHARHGRLGDDDVIESFIGGDVFGAADDVAAQHAALCHALSALQR